MSNEELELKLLKGSTIIIDGIKIQPLILGEIIDDLTLGYDKYIKLLSVLGVDKRNLKDVPDDVLSQITNFDIFLSDEQLMNLLIDFLRTFLQYKDIFFIPENQSIVFDYSGELAWINKYNLDSIFEIFRKMYNVQFSKEQEYNPANAKASELVERIKRKNAEYAKLKKTSESNLASMISGVAWKSNNINLFDIFNLTVFQLYDAYYRLEIVDNCSNTMSGIYAGTVDQKKIDFKQLTWIKRYINSEN